MSLNSNSLHISKKQLRNTLVYSINESQPFSGGFFTLHENGQDQTIESYKNGKKDGEWSSWYMTGQLKFIESYKDGEKDGEWSLWYENGQLKSIESYKDGEKDGEWFSWYENGQLDSIESYKDGEKDGEWFSWYKNGQEKTVKSYKNDRRVGELCSWYENGQKNLDNSIELKFVNKDTLKNKDRIFPPNIPKKTKKWYQFHYLFWLFFIGLFLFIYIVKQGYMESLVIPTFQFISGVIFILSFIFNANMLLTKILDSAYYKEYSDRVRSLHSWSTIYMLIVILYILW